MAEEIVGEAPAAEASEETPTTALTEDEGTEAKASEDGASAEASEETDHKADDTTEKSTDSDADGGESGAPENYEPFQLPDGIEMNSEALEQLTPMLKDMGASQDQAQKLIDLQTETVQNLFAGQQRAWTDKQSEWRKAAENDDEFGKGKYDASLTVARRAMREIGTPELTDALNESGMGNHREFIRFFYRVGVAIGEDNLSFGTANQQGKKSAADRIFPDQGK